MPENGRAAAQEWRENWKLVLAAMFGMSFSAVAVNSLGLFMAPLQAEFGWSRAQISSGLTIYAFAAVPLSPFVGGLIDRWGARALAIPGLILAGSAYAAFGAASASPVSWWILWLCYSLVAVGIKTTVWTSAVSSMFNAARGLALGVTLCGMAMGASFAPVLSRWLIDEFGWRAAFQLTGAGWGSVAVVVTALFFFDARDRDKRQRKNDPTKTAPVVLAGIDFAQVMRNPAFLKIATAVFLITLLMVAMVVHFVPILTQEGLSREQAAGVAATMGVAALVGKLGAGWLLDRHEGGPLASISFGAPLIPCLILLFPSASVVQAMVAIVTFGLASGAQVQTYTYLTTRYVGLRTFGKTYGILISLVALATGTGPVAAGALYDHFGNYRVLFIFGIVMSALCILLVSRLGPYPTFENEKAEA
jgi:MFS family permease